MTHVSDCHCAICCPALSSEGTPTARPAIPFALPPEAPADTHVA
jgi:hypothetical protein